MAAVSFNMKGGRSSVSGIKATVFGGSGFLGSFVINRLGKIGSSVIVPYRGDELHVLSNRKDGQIHIKNPVHLHTNPWFEHENPCD